MRYAIRVAGLLDGHWSGRLDGAEIRSEPASATTLILSAGDPARLHGVLATLRDLGAVLLEVRIIDQP